MIASTLFLACFSTPALVASASGDMEISPFVAEREDVGLGRNIPLYWSPWNACGQVAVFSVCRSMDVNVSLERVATEIPIQENGSSMSSLVDFLNQAGLEASGYEISLTDLQNLLKRDASVRAIIHVDDDHWIPIFGANDTTFDVFAYPKRADIATDDIATRYSEKAIVVASDRRWLGFEPVSTAIWTSVLSVASVLILLGKCHSLK